MPTKGTSVCAWSLGPGKGCASFGGFAVEFVEVESRALQHEEGADLPAGYERGEGGGYRPYYGRWIDV